MVVTLFGMVILVKPQHISNVLDPMLVTPFGMLMLVKVLQKEKALLPILVTIYIFSVSFLTYFR